MKKIYYLLPLACSMPVLLSCSTPAPHAESAMRIQPVLSIRNSDSSARGFYQLGRYYQGQNRLDQAADAYRKALDLHAAYVDARNALATIYSAQGKFDEAIAEFTAVLKIVPELAHVYNNLGYTYYLQNNYVEAIAAFEKAIALEPRNQRAFNNLGSAYQKLGNPEKSRLAFARAAELNSPNVSANDDKTSHAVAAGEAAANGARSVPIAGPGVTVELQTQRASVALNTASDGPATTLAETSLPATALEPASPGVAETQSKPETPVADVPTLFVYDRKLLPNKLFSVAIAADGNGAWAGRFEQAIAFRLEIANGNGVTGLARKVGDTLVRNGSPLPKLTNLKPFQQRHTVIQYRTGFEGEAVRLSRKLINPPTLVNNDHLRKSADVRLVLGKDMVSQVALFGPGIEAVRLVYNDPVE